MRKPEPIQIELPDDGPASIVRWAGSKSRLLDRILPFVPEKFGTYFEPFLGSGALFFKIKPGRAYLGDLCRPLIETYQAVRDNPARVIQHLNGLRLDAETYYEMRSAKPKGRYQQAARFLYLNRGCWNGLYRVNLHGEFNVPFGRPRTPNVFDATQIWACHECLNKLGVGMAVRDFSDTLSGVRKGDFVFLDPPYVTKHNLNGFAEWNEKIFSWADQERLADLASTLASRGAHVVVTNADHQDVVALYPKFQHHQLSRHSTLAGDKSKRTKVTEAILVSPL